MRLWVLLLVLFSAFGLAGVVQSSWIDSVRRERARGHSPTDMDGNRTWRKVIIGRPSGASARAPSPRARPELRAAEPEDPSKRQGNGLGFRMVVRGGQSLSTICQDHYGSARTELVQGLARFNQLEHPDRLRVGQALVLPPVEDLTPP